MKPDTILRIRDHGRVLELYRNNERLADLLYAAGNEEGAEEARELGRNFSRERVLDRILYPDTPDK